MNLIKFQSYDPASVLQKVTDIPVKEPKRIQVLKPKEEEDWGTYREEFIIQFKGESKAYLVPNCEAGEYLF